MRESILNFNKQFEYEPEIIYPDKLASRGRFIIAGMGGSNLASELLKIRDPYLDIIIHRDYGLPAIQEGKLREYLFAANSHSGNTEETIDAFDAALKSGTSVFVIATGGKLIELAEEKGIPHIQTPAAELQPRLALGFNIKAMAKMMGRNDFSEELSQLASILNPLDFEERGKNLADKLKSRVPVIYSSARNFGIAYTWKIKFNESGKTPAFYNVFSELNHNEIAGFDAGKNNNELSGKFHFIFLKDSSDHPKIQKRMDVLSGLYKDKGLPVEVIDLEGKNQFQKIFSSLILADWASYYTAKHYNVDPEANPMVEEFKKLMK